MATDQTFGVLAVAGPRPGEWGYALFTRPISPDFAHSPGLEAQACAALDTQELARKLYAAGHGFDARAIDDEAAHVTSGSAR